MSYKGINDKSLPKYVLSRSESIKRRWVNMYNAAEKKFGGKKAMLIANLWLKKQVKSSGFMARSTFKFDIYTKNGFLIRDSNGEEYVTLVLNTKDSHKDGVTFTEELLKDMAKQINDNPIVGDIDHALYYKILKTGMSDEQVKMVLRSKPGIAKTVKAIYDKGKLWVRAIIDKRYSRLVKKSKGVSSEIFYSKREGNSYSEAEILGFTFNFKTTPAEYGAGVCA
jgi:hypothetical protein